MGAGAATLYSAEYYDLVTQHLNPGGLVAQWVPMYETDEAAVKSQIATFVQAFPHTTLWSSDYLELGYDLVLLGRLQPTRVNAVAIDLQLRDNDALRLSLEDVDLGSGEDLIWTFAGRGRDLAPWLRDAEINRERSLRLQYLAGLALDLEGAYGIYDEILRYRRYPEDLFRVPPALETELRRNFRSDD